MREIKKSAARNIMVLMVESSDHVTGATGKTLTITASKNGAAFASISPTVTERADGWYSIALTSSHTDTIGDLVLHITATDCDPADLLCNVVQIDGNALEYFGAISAGTAQAVTSTSITLAASETAADDTVVGSVVYVSSATTGHAQARIVTDYVASTKVATVSPAWTVTPSGTINYVLSYAPPAPTDSAVIPSVAVSSLAANSITASALAADAGTEIGTAVWANGTRTLTANPGLDSTAIQSAAAAALVAYDPPTKSELDAAVAPLATASGLTSATAPLATSAALATVAGYVDTEVAAIKAVTDKIDTALQADGAAYQFTSGALELAPTGGGGGLDAAGVRAAIGLASANLDTQLAAIVDDTGTSLPALISALNDVSITELLYTQLTETYASNGVVPTVAQALLAIHQRLMDFSISGTSRTVNNFAGGTAFVSSFDDATSPTGETR